MGSDSTKTHEAFSVAPSHALDPADAADAADLTDSTADGETPDAAAAIPLDKVHHTLALIEELAGHPDHEDLHGELAALVTSAHAELAAADVDDEDRALTKKQIAAAAADALASLPDETLHQLAAEQGFAHPALVSAGALGHWLNPAYPDHAASKAKIAAKADERYHQLAGGEVDAVHGQTLAEVQATDVHLTAPPDATGAWQASPADVAMAIADVNQRLADLEPTSSGDDGGLVALLAAERRLRTAACAGMEATDLDTAKAAASGLVDQQLADVDPYQRRAMVAAAVIAAAAEGSVTDPQARWLDRDAQLSLLRAATPAEVRSHLEATATERAEQVSALDDARAAIDAAGGAAPDGPASAAEWAAACGQLHAARTTVAAWAQNAADRPALVEAGVTYPWALKQQAKERTTAWRAWAKGQAVGTVRAAATELGLDQASQASRAQLQNYVAASWDPALDAAGIQQQVTSKNAKPSGPPTTPATSSTAPSPPGASSVTPIASAGSWAAKHADAVAALKAHQALATDVPAPQPNDEIAALTLSKPKRATVGGMHRKTLHTDPDGRAWLHKPDKGGGARAHAEAAAARLHHLAGVRTPPVYVREVGGTVGSLQPWVAGGEPLPGDPGQWPQAEVDSVVRFHVASWVCSNHDGNPTNVLRTPSGGVAPIDHGQAWRYFGEDRLSADYDPNGAYGNPPPAHTSAYKAAASGGLAAGVRVRPEAALPVIKAFEQLPDAQFRAELAPVATAGVQAGLPWVSRMRKAAAKRLGTTHVTDAQVTDEFLTQAVERKQRLRGDLAAFFSGLGLAGDRLEKVA